MMGSISPYNTIIAPAFYVSQVDLAGPFLSYSAHNKRATVKVWFAVFCCCTTSAVKLKLMEDYSSQAFIQAFIRLSCEVGYPKVVLPDEGSQLLKGCEDMKFNFRDVRNKLYADMKVEFDPCPVGGHYMHGRVERKIKEVKKSIERSFQHERLSIIQWETVASQVANCINDMPLAHGNIVGDFEVADLLTPNRLLLGRNNNRSPDGPMLVTSDADKFVRSNEKIFNSWFEVWLTTYLPHLMKQEKWFDTTHVLQEGDIVLFLKRDSAIQNKYQYGIVSKVIPSKDGVIRKARIKYRNFNESSFRETYRSVRELILISSIDDINIMEEIQDIGLKIDSKFRSSET